MSVGSPRSHQSLWRPAVHNHHTLLRILADDRHDALVDAAARSGRRNRRGRPPASHAPPRWHRRHAEAR